MSSDRGRGVVNNAWTRGHVRSMRLFDLPPNPPESKHRRRRERDELRKAEAEWLGREAAESDDIVDARSAEIAKLR